MTKINLETKARAGFEAIMLRGGRLVKRKGQVISFAPHVGQLSSVSCGALAAGLALGASLLGGVPAYAGTCDPLLPPPGTVVTCTGALDPANDTAVVIDGEQVTVNTTRGFGISTSAGNGLNIVARIPLSATPTSPTCRPRSPISPASSLISTRSLSVWIKGRGRRMVASPLPWRWVGRCCYLIRRCRCRSTWRLIAVNRSSRALSSPALKRMSGSAVVSAVQRSNVPPVDVLASASVGKGERDVRRKRSERSQ